MLEPILLFEKLISLGWRRLSAAKVPVET